MFIVATPFQTTLTRLGLDSFSRIRELFLGGDALVPAGVVVKPASLALPDGATLAVFYKQYEYAPAEWKFIGRKSKAHCEFENYTVFARLGVPCAQPIACGEERDSLGRLRRAFILTQALTEALTLKEYFKQRLTNRKDATIRRKRAEALQQLAAAVRTIHTADFFHHDLVWRNLLATETADGTPRLWWIDCPRGGFDRWSPWRAGRRLKDLASLDKVASRLCTRRERVEWLLHYLGKTELDPESRKLARAALEYRRKRWPDDWP